MCSASSISPSLTVSGGRNRMTSLAPAQAQQLSADSVLRYGPAITILEGHSHSRSQCCPPPLQHWHQYPHICNADTTLAPWGLVGSSVKKNVSHLQLWHEGLCLGATCRSISRIVSSRWTRLYRSFLHLAALHGKNFKTAAASLHKTVYTGHLCVL